METKLRCTRCGVENSREWLEIPNSGIYCRNCTEALAKQGRQQIAEERITLGNDVVDKRIRDLQDGTSSAITKH